MAITYSNGHQALKIQKWSIKKEMNECKYTLKYFNYILKIVHKCVHHRSCSPNLAWTASRPGIIWYSRYPCSQTTFNVDYFENFRIIPFRFVSFPEVVKLIQMRSDLRVLLYVIEASVWPQGMLTSLRHSGSCFRNHLIGICLLLWIVLACLRYELQMIFSSFS